MKNKIIVGSIILANILVQNSSALSLKQIDNRNFELKNQNQTNLKETKIVYNKSKSKNLVTKKEKEILSKNSLLKKIQKRIKEKESNLNNNKWYNKKITLQASTITLNTLLHDIVPHGIKKTINLLQKKDGTPYTMSNIDMINRPVKEILDAFCLYNNLYFDYTNNEIKINYIKNKMYFIPVSDNIQIKTNVTLGTGENSNSATGSNLTSKISVNSSELSKLIKTFNDLLNETKNVKIGEKIIYDKTTGIMNVIATRRNSKIIDNYLKEIINSEQKQILIEAKILNFRVNNSTAVGIKWNKLWNNISHGVSLDSAIGMLKGSANGLFGQISNTPVSTQGTGEFTISNKSNSTQLFISALSQLGNVQTLSEPTLLVINNKTSTINSGKIINYVKQITVTPVDGGDPTISLEPGKIQDGFSMVVNAKVTKSDKNINLFLAPMMNTTLEIKKEGNPDVGQIGLPIIDSRSLSLFTRIKSGDTIILGGLKNTSKVKNSNGIPILNQVPLIKNLFGYKEKVLSKDELIIMVKATIIN